MYIYIASSWRNEYQPLVVKDLRRQGYEVYDFKDSDGFQWKEVDPEWQQWTPTRYIEGLSHPYAKRGFQRDMDALMKCDVCIYVAPCGVSASLEAGWACGNGKLLIAYIPEIKEPDLMLKMANLVTNEFAEVKREIRRYLIDVSLRY